MMKYVKKVHQIFIEKISGVKWSMVRHIASKLQGICVISPLDKWSSMICCICPKFWRETLLDFIQRSCPVYDNDEAEEQVKKLHQKMGYTKCCNRKNHVWALLSWWPKVSGLLFEHYGLEGVHVKQDKFRFVCFYFKHMNKPAYSLVTRVLQYSPHKTFGGGFAVKSGIEIRQKIGDAHDSVKEKCGDVFVADATFAKFDIDNFYNNIPKALILSSLDYLIRELYAKCGGRKRLWPFQTRKKRELWIWQDHNLFLWCIELRKRFLTIIIFDQGCNVQKELQKNFIAFTSLIFVR